MHNEKIKDNTKLRTIIINSLSRLESIRGYLLKNIPCSGYISGYDNFTIYPKSIKGIDYIRVEIDILENNIKDVICGNFSNFESKSIGYSRFIEIVDSGESLENILKEK